MHFWINKAAGRNYDFAGRRYPVTKSSGHRCRGVRSMVTPVHRFQNLNGTSTAGPSFQSTARPHRSVSRNSPSEPQNCPTNVSLPLLRPDNVLNNVTNVGNNHHVLSSSANTANRDLLDFSSLASDAELVGYRLRCGVWIMFVVVTGFVTAAKFYFDHQGTGLEVLVFCGLLVSLLLSGCFYTILCWRSSPSRWNQTHRLPEVHRHAIVCTTSATTPENMREIPVVRQNPPPPYHIAILIPPINSPDEVPPPSYDKIMQ